ncbi:VAMP5 [Lepeophtheirus salmonis]|uniref:VAMP5 n=1 Tax=Lepeophtheirus salmonis TaxID=72036 RepID=A0A7R8H1L4_LEPSM|nr:VAMP5 [Lepeophtheirus salmonis]CAF2796075.1 VAMP5 [Lepeophtheirus salmonis]
MSKSDAHLEETRRQVDEVQNIMKGNVEKMLERDGKLGQLEERADRLQEGTEQFHRSAVRIKRKQRNAFYKNIKIELRYDMNLTVNIFDVGVEKVVKVFCSYLTRRLNL